MKLQAVIARLRTDRRGLAAAEFALVLPLLVLMMGGVVDFGRFLWFQTEVTQALRAGMQYAMNDPNDTSGINQIIQKATTLWPSPNFTVSNPVQSCSCSDGSTPSGGCTSGTCPSGTIRQNWLTLTASYSYAPLIGTMGGLLPKSVSDTMVLRIQ